MTRQRINSNCSRGFMISTSGDRDIFEMVILEYMLDSRRLEPSSWFDSNSNRTSLFLKSLSLDPKKPCMAIKCHRRGKKKWGGGRIKRLLIYLISPPTGSQYLLVHKMKSTSCAANKISSQFRSERYHIISEKNRC